jgi:hypothetical protein
MRGAASANHPAQPPGRFTLAPSNLRLLCWLVVSVAGFLEAIGHRFQTDVDGINYIEVGENYLRGDWHHAVNAYWSPLYSWLLAIPLSFLHSSLYWESTLVHLVDFVIFLASYAAFEFLLTELLRSPLAGRLGHDPAAGLSELAWRILGLALFLYSSLIMAYYNGNTPDLCVTLAAYTAAGLLLRINSGLAGWGTYFCLGATSGLGYLAKAVMFPLAFVFLGVALFAPPAPAKARAKFAVAVLVFALFSGPWIAVLSHSKGRLTFGDSGKLNYVADSSMPSEHSAWGDVLPSGMHFVHPLPKLNDHPAVFVFPTPVGGTFPPWYDPSYWSEGTRLQFHWRAQLRSLRKVYNAYLDLLNAQGAFLLAFLALLLAQGEFRKNVARFARLWALWLPGLAALGLYALLHIETRFIAAFVTLVWLGLFASVRLPEGDHSHHWPTAVLLALFLVTFIPIARNLVSDAHLLFRPPPDTDWAVAQELHRLGVPPGGAIALIGMPKETFYFAHLAQVRVVAAVPPDAVGEYWFAPPDIQAHVRSLFAAAGATAIVTSDVPPGDHPAGWSRMAFSSDWVMLLSNSVATSSMPVHPAANSGSTHD